jgi:hypothetical protein
MDLFGVEDFVRVFVETPAMRARHGHGFGNCMPAKIKIAHGHLLVFHNFFTTLSTGAASAKTSAGRMRVYLEWRRGARHRLTRCGPT